MGKKKPIAELPKVKGVGSPRPTRKIARFSARPTGPELYKLGKRPARIGSGPGAPPLGYVLPASHNSGTEWLVYWALAKLTGDPPNPRMPPFTGSRLGKWVVQSADQGGRVPGGSVTDFAVSTPTGWIGIRVDTERFHTTATPKQQMKDLFLKTHVKAVQKVITVYEQHFIQDSGPQGTGEAVCKVVALALRGIELPNPILAGNARRTRPI